MRNEWNLKAALHAYKNTHTHIPSLEKHSRTKEQAMKREWELRERLDSVLVKAISQMEQNNPPQMCVQILRG